MNDPQANTQNGLDMTQAVQIPTNQNTGQNQASPTNSNPTNPDQNSGLDLTKAVPIDNGTVPKVNNTESLEDTLKKGDDFVTNLNEKYNPVMSPAIGLAKGIGDTGHTIGRLINAATGDKVSWLPTSTKEPQYLEANGALQDVGKIGENIAEFMLGDEALKGVSIAEKLGIAQKLTDLAMKSPTLSKALGMGITAVRHGVVTGTEALGKGATPQEAAIAGGTGAITSFGAQGLGAGVSKVRGAMKTAAKSVQELQPDFQQGIKDLIDQVTKEQGVPNSKAASIREYAQEAGENIEKKAVDTLQEVDKAAKEPFIQKFQQRIKNIDREIRMVAAGEDSPEVAELYGKREDIFNDMEQAYNEARANLPPGTVPEQQVKEGLQMFKKAQAMKDLGVELNKPSVTSGSRPHMVTAKQLAEKPEVVNPNTFFTRIDQMVGKGRLQEALGDTRAGSMYRHASQAAIDHTSLAQQIAESKETLKTAKRIAGTTAAAAGLGYGLSHIGSDIASLVK